MMFRPRCLIQKTFLLTCTLSIFLLCSCKSSQETSKEPALIPEAEDSSTAASLSESDLPVLECTHTEETGSLLCSITIRTNTPKVRIFLNGEFQGNSELTIEALSEGRYYLSAQKKGFDGADFFIDARRGRHDSFYIHLTENAKTSPFTDGNN